MVMTSKPLSVREKGNETSANDMVRVNLQVPKETRIRWHTEAMRRGVSLTEMIRRVVDADMPKM